MNTSVYNISNLLIDINVLGDINHKINKFNPKMIYNMSSENNILFIPNVPIDMKTLSISNIVTKQENYKPSDFLPVFSNPILLNELVQYIIKKKKIKPVNIEEAERKGYINQNINLILSIYFNSNNKIKINNRNYPIHSYNWNKDYDKIYTKKTFPDFNINIDLYVLNDKSSVKFSEKGRISCDIKRRKIALDLRELGYEVDIPTVGKAEPPKYSPSIRGGYYSKKRGKYNRKNTINKKKRMRKTIKKGKYYTK